MISIVIPCLNEEAALPQAYTRLSAAAATWGEPCEFLLVDDGSTDGTWGRIRAFSRRDPRWKGLRLARNFGHQAALGAGLHCARGDAVVCIDADLQDPPELIGEFVQRWRAGADVVYGVRKERPEGLLKRCCYAGFYRLLGAAAHVDLPAHAGDFALLDRKVVRALRACREQRPFWRGLRAWVGFRQEGVPYGRHSRQAGTPQYTLGKLLKLSADGFWSLTTLPLSLFTAAALLAALAAAVGAGCLAFTDRPASAAGAALGLGALNLLGLTLMGRYQARLLDESRRRPRWIVAERVGFGRPARTRRRRTAAVGAA